jgi:hypothetical protein
MGAYADDLSMRREEEMMENPGPPKPSEARVKSMRNSALFGCVIAGSAATLAYLQGDIAVAVITAFTFWTALGGYLYWARRH